MSHHSDAIGILRSDGPLALGRRMLGYGRYLLGSKLWRAYYRVKARLLGNDVVTIGGVSLDAGLAPPIVSKLRTRR